tara:strand:- start:61 stop:846 length:786 start_codon:yes stop_codon:yes gene_type:complete
MPQRQLDYKAEAAKLLQAYETPKEYEFITQDDDCLCMLKQADKLAQRPESVLITGESGTGKELVARRLHGRRSGRFIALNLASIPDSMLQAELFGHVKGSYSGAYSNRMGLLMAASKGTVFLDEIGEISPNLQVLLLRLVETRKFRRMGENEDSEFTGRFVFATNRIDSDFRNDLYHRIATFRLHIKPLRQRMEDASLILKDTMTQVEYEDFLKLINDNRKSCSKSYPKLLGGNVRELLRLAKQYKVLGPDGLDFRWEGTH